MAKIERSKERVKQTGEVFTPLPLVDEILEKLPQELFTDPKKTFLDPACGDGNFLVRVVAYKIFHGSTPKQALETTFGVDIMEDNISHCRERLLTHAWAASKLKSQNSEIILPHLTVEDERKLGQVKGRDQFARKYDEIIVKNIVCADSLNGWDFENWCPKNGQPEQKESQPAKSTIEDLLIF